MSEHKTIGLYRQAKKNLSKNPKRSVHYCPSECCSTYIEEFEHVKRDAATGDSIAVEFWNEFMRLRMTT